MDLGQLETATLQWKQTSAPLRAGNWSAGWDSSLDDLNHKKEPKWDSEPLES